MEDVPSNPVDTQVIQIIYQLNDIYEQFEQCQDQAERAKFYLIKEKHFTPTQYKRATQFLVHLDTPTRDLRDLLKQIPQPANIALHSRDLYLILLEIEKEKLGLQEDIDVKDMREQIIDCVEDLGNHLKQLVQELKKTFEPPVLPDRTAKQSLKELNNTSPESLLVARKDSLPMGFDPELGIRRLYELFKREKRQPLSMLGVLDARLQRNLQDKRVYGDTKDNKAEWTEIVDSLIWLAATEFDVAFNDLCHSLPVQQSGQNGAAMLGKAEERERASGVEWQLDFDFLCDLLVKYTEDISLQRICRSLGVDYASLEDKSHETRAFSLAQKMENQNRLDDLEKELRKLLPRRFPPENQ